MAEVQKFAVKGTVYFDAEGNAVGKKEAVTSESRECTVTGTPGDSLEEAIDLYGEELVFNLYQANYAIKIGNAARAILKAGGDQAEVTKQMEGWKPDTTRKRSAAKESIDDLFAQMDPDAQAAFIQRIKEQAGL